MTDPTPRDSPGLAVGAPPPLPGLGVPDDAALREAMNRVRIEVGKAVIGQDGGRPWLLIALLARGSRASGGRAGCGEDAARRALARVG